MKGLFIPDITTEMFRNGCLEGIEALMAEGELYDIEYNPKQPTIEPERKKGKWEITEAYPHNVYCSECHKKFAQTHWAVWEDRSLPRNFCPNCGAEMREDGEADEAD